MRCLNFNKFACILVFKDGSAQETMNPASSVAAQQTEPLAMSEARTGVIFTGEDEDAPHCSAQVGSGLPALRAEAT